MRILYSHRIQSRDGQSVHVEELIKAFRQAGHEVLVVGPSFYQESGFGGESSKVAMLRMLLPGFLSELAELAYNIPAYLRLRRAWKSFRPDFVYERYNLHYFAGALLARRHRALLYLEVNSPLAAERSEFGNLRLRRLAHASERFVWRAATRVLPVTGVIGRIIEAVGVAAERIVVIPNGVVLERFPPPRPSPAHGSTTLGFVGFVRSWHGLDEVLDLIAAATEQTLNLTVIGDGPARPDLERQAAALGIASRCKFMGLVDHAQVPALVADFDIALQPRVTPHASPLKIFDYMAAGCAIIAPDQPNIREILSHEQTALLFDPATPGSLREAVRRLTVDGDLRQRLGAAARRMLEEKNYTWNGNAQRIAGLAEMDLARRS